MAKSKNNQLGKITAQPCKPGERIECQYEKLEPIDKLHPNPANPNRHSEEQVEKLAKLIELHGWRLPIVVSNRSGLIVSGHGRLMAAKSLGISKVPVDFQDFQNEAEETAVLISDNVVADLSEFDGLKMAELLNELDVFNVNLEDFTALDQDQILDFIHGPDGMPPVEGLTDEDDVPEPPKVAITKPGDLWLLGAYWECEDCGKKYDYDEGKSMKKGCPCGKA